MVAEGVQESPASPDEIARLLIRYRRHLLDAGILARDSDSRYCSYFEQLVHSWLTRERSDLMPPELPLG
jgi:hypothetical protein